MSLTQEELEAAKARDARFAAVAAGIEAQAAVRHGSALRQLLDALRQDADEAMVAFSETNPADTASIIGLQARVKCFTFAYQTFKAIIAAGELAEHSLQTEHEAELYVSGRDE